MRYWLNFEFVFELSTSSTLASTLMAGNEDTGEVDGLEEGGRRSTWTSGSWSIIRNPMLSFVIDFIIHHQFVGKPGELSNW